ncbi:hypothetical protein METSCH_E02960 [Metschnikowia aff. pulcherrima]|uniref:Uncharacterized protein n=1 Tax=Metschnikowia aff. pulcherrima TaxID=2163413 RepID=A0A4P6XR70_9ASCO|nr:hypothetical protein METSCH_E02960 [Metschnikowia aff. pulcherrima]
MSDTVKNIATSVAGSLGGNKVADGLHLGNGGHMASGIAGSILAGDAERKAEEEKNKH